MKYNNDKNKSPMEELKEIIVLKVDEAFREMTVKDLEYIKLEKEKESIINNLKAELSDENFAEIKKLIDCLESQNYISAMCLSCSYMLDFGELIKEK